MLFLSGSLPFGLKETHTDCSLKTTNKHSDNDVSSFVGLYSHETIRVVKELGVSRMPCLYEHHEYTTCL